MTMPPEEPRLIRLTKICLALPQATRNYNGRHAGFQVRKKTFVYFLNDHHGDGIMAVFGAAALNVSPRLGHLHVTVDDLPWHWADTSDNNTIDLVAMTPGQHKVLIELVNPEHQVFAACATCSQTATFTILAVTLVNHGSLTPNHLAQVRRKSTFACSIRFGSASKSAPVMARAFAASVIAW